MFALAFDLVVADTHRYHPKGVSQAYNDIAQAWVYRHSARMRQKAWFFEYRNGAYLAYVSNETQKKHAL